MALIEVSIEGVKSSCLSCLKLKPSKLQPGFFFGGGDQIEVVLCGEDVNSKYRSQHPLKQAIMVIKASLFNDEELLGDRRGTGRR